MATSNMRIRPEQAKKQIKEPTETRAEMQLAAGKADYLFDVATVACTKASTRRHTAYLLDTFGSNVAV